MSSSMASLALLVGLELLPVHEHLVGVGHLHVAEHVRVPVDQLVDQALRHVVHVPPSVVGRDLGVERHLQQQVAELLADRVGVVGVDRLDQLVGLLEQVAGERLVRLLRVPGAAVGSAQPRLDADQVEQPLPTLAGRDRLAHVDHAEGLDTEAAPASVSVLEMRTTCSVSVSNRPYFGFTSTPWA